MIIGYAVFTDNGLERFDTETEAKKHGDIILPIIDVIIEEVKNV